MYWGLLSAVLLTLASTCLAQFTYAPVDVPGAAATVARGINNAGGMVRPAHRVERGHGRQGIHHLQGGELSRLPIHAAIRHE